MGLNYKKVLPYFESAATSPAIDVFAKIKNKPKVHSLGFERVKNSESFLLT
jgi:hypothetical protein